MTRDKEPREPADAPVSSDQSDLPEISQLMPLSEPIPIVVPPPLREWNQQGVYLTPQQLQELRMLTARRDRAQNDITEFYQRNVHRRGQKGQ